MIDVFSKFAWAIPVNFKDANALKATYGQEHSKIKLEVQTLRSKT